MSIKCLLFRYIFKQAHLAMKLGRYLPPSKLKCYDKDKYNPDSARDIGCEYIVISSTEFTLWKNVGDHGPLWESSSYNGIDDLIFNYHKPYIYDKFATYTLFITQLKYGLYYDFIMNDDEKGWYDKYNYVRDIIGGRLDQYLNSFAYKASKSILNFFLNSQH